MGDNVQNPKPLGEGHRDSDKSDVFVEGAYVNDCPEQGQEQEQDDETDVFEQAARMEALRLSTMALVAALKNLYGEVETRENEAIDEWKEKEPLLQQRKWACKQQIEILDREIEDLQRKANDVQQKLHRRLSFARTIYKEVLTSFYEVHNPEKIADIEKIMNTFRGREHELIKAMFTRYGTDIDTEKLLNAGVVAGTKISQTSEYTADGIGFSGDEHAKALQDSEDQLWNEVATLEEMRTRAIYQFEEVSRELHFPKALRWNFKHGFEGIYFGMHDFWVDDITLRLILETFNIRGTPHLGIDIQRGKVSFRLDNFCLKGDKGTKIPSLSPVQLTLTVDFTVKVPLEFRQHQNSGRWRIGNNFKVKIIDIKHEIKGSIVGIPASLLRLVANRFLPGLVKSLLIDAVPPEFGNYLVHLYHFHGNVIGKTPIKFNLNLQVSGRPNKVIDVLDRVLWRTNKKKKGWLASSPSLEEAEAVKVQKESIIAPNSNLGQQPHSHTHASARVSSSGDDPITDLARIMMGLTIGQARTLHLIQREMNLVNEELMKSYDTRERKSKDKPVNWPGILKTAAEFVRFYSRYSEQSSSSPNKEMHDTWDSILDAWQQVIDKYQRSVPNVEHISIREFFAGVASLSQKPVAMRFDVDELCMHTSVDAGAKAICDFLVRSTQELYKQSNNKKKVVLTKSLTSNLSEIRKSYKLTADALELVKKFVTKFNFRVDTTIQDGDFMVKGSKINFIGPVSLHVPIVSGYYEHPNFSVRTSVTKNGTFDIEILIRSSDGTDSENLVKFNLGEISADIFFDIESFLMEKFKSLREQSSPGNVADLHIEPENVEGNNVVKLKEGMETLETRDKATKPEGVLKDDVLHFIRHCYSVNPLPILKSSFGHAPSEGFNFNIACAPKAQLKVASESFYASGRLETVGDFAYDYIEKETIKAKEERERINSSDSSSQVDRDSSCATAENFERLKPLQNLIKMLTKHRKTRGIRLSLILGFGLKVVESKINRRKELALDMSLFDQGDDVRSISFENEFSLLDLISDIMIVLGLLQGD